MATEYLLGIDQYGEHWNGIDADRPKASLLELTCRKTAVPMYIGDGQQIGYVIKPERGSGESELWMGLFHVKRWTP